MLQRYDTFDRQQQKYGHTCCKRCFGNEQSFKDHRRRVMLSDNPFKGKKHTQAVKDLVAKLRTGHTPWNKGTGRKKPVNQAELTKWLKFRKEYVAKETCGCYKCGSKNRLELHHIVSKTKVPDLKYEESNIIVLCYWCHKNFHKTHTIRNFHPNDTIAFLNEGRKEKDWVFFC